ncbi:MAG TPA: hypothetical protein VFA32_00630, partial [Dehalococcoidia bacterium]|nr:hypothetical protein [Dehalococcoidia bacterium]
RNPDPSWDMKCAIWDLAAKLGKDKYAAIQRSLDRLYERGELPEDVPDGRSIKGVIAEIQLLSIPVLRTLEEHIWLLREDYEWILASLQAQTWQREGASHVTDKRRQHEELLVSGLKALRRSPLGSDLPSYMNWETGEPTKDFQEDIERNISFSDTIAVQCLLKHLESEDPILVGYAKSGEIHNEYIQCCGELQRKLVNVATQASTELGIPLGIRWYTRTAAITPEFAASLYRIAGALVFSSPDQDELKFRYHVYQDQKDLIQLFAGGFCIALVPKSRSDEVEGVYLRLYLELKQNALIPQLRDKRQQLELQVKELNHAVEIRVQQRTFLPGPCEICSAWGGLLAY